VNLSNELHRQAGEFKTSMAQLKHIIGQGACETAPASSPITDPTAAAPSAERASSSLPAKRSVTPRAQTKSPVPSFESF